MNKKLLNKFLIIGSCIFAISTIVFLGIAIFVETKDIIYFSIALASSIICNILNKFEELLKS